ncbi:YncE family protein [Dokdonella soli]|uniref:YncE family protein n=1 Tax=Dokdonella soli TaxID=529810 RepID=A0ABP3TNH6_9GAMM
MKANLPKSTLRNDCRNTCWLAAAAALFSLSSAASAQPFYRLESAVVLKGAAPDWDYVTLDPVRSYLYIGRRGDGVMVYDVAAKKEVMTIENSKGAGSIKLVPELDRGYTANEDGSTTMFKLSTLKTLKRVQFGKDSDAVFYEPLTRQLVFTMGDSHALGFVDAGTGKVVGQLAMDSHKLDASAPDGQGNLFVAERDKDRVAKVDVKRRKVAAEWNIDGCSQPTGLAFDSTNQRIFIGCRGDKPVLAVMDSGTGKVVTTLPIGRGNDGVVFNAQSRQIYASNGVDANLVIYAQVDANSYALIEADTTRPYARTMALDPKSGKVYTVTAEGAADPAKKINTAVSAFYPNTYFDDTFTVLTYSRK